MNKFCIALFSLLLFTINNLTAQIKGVTVSPSLYNYGEVNNWKNPPAIFTIVNTGDKPLVFLPTFPMEDIMVELPKAPINKNESATIAVYYYTSLPGSFQKETKVYVNISDQPIVLKIQGDINTFSAEALISCPGFSNKTFAEQQSFKQEILVIDKETQQPIAEATVKLLGNDLEYNEVTNQSGRCEPKIMLGLHDILVAKKGYQPELRIFYLNRNTGLVTIELIRDSTYKEPVVVVNEVVDTPQREETLLIPTNTLTTAIPVSSKEVLPAEKYNANNIVFLIDASGSMKAIDKLPLMKKSVLELLEVLRAIDKLSMVTYSAGANVLFSGITADKKKQLAQQIDTLQAKGYTNGLKGIETAYAIAEKNFAFTGNNQIILATDGLFNNPTYDESALINLVKRKAEMGIKLSIVGFGNDPKAHRLMKKLTFVGRGNFIQIKNGNDSTGALIEEVKSNSAK
jgi:Mg-chelatase subunit ChlD